MRGPVRKRSAPGGILQSTNSSDRRDIGFWASFERRAHVDRRVTTAFRVLHRGEWARHDLAMDCYDKFLVVWIYEAHPRVAQSLAAIQGSLTPYIDAMRMHYQLRGAILKRVNRDPHAHALIAEECVVGKSPPDPLVVVENGLRFEVRLTGRQHVGLFLDQRDNRARVRAMAKGERVANLFAYTCSFSVAAAAGGAEVVFSVDSARSSLQIGKKNFKLNRLEESGRGKFIEADVRDWLAKQAVKREEYGLIICDPPTFSSGSRAPFSVEKEWDGLARSCRLLLRKGGYALFSTNHQAEDKDYYFKRLTQHFKSVERLTPPADFPVLPGKPEHVKLFGCK